MTATLIKGAEVAASIRDELKAEVGRLKERWGVVPGLVTILVGRNPASESYVRAKQKTAHELGFYSVQEDQPEDMTEESLLALVNRYNADPEDPRHPGPAAPAAAHQRNQGAPARSIRRRTSTRSTP